MSLVTERKFNDAIECNPKKYLSRLRSIRAKVPRKWLATLIAGAFALTIADSHYFVQQSPLREVFFTVRSSPSPLPYHARRTFMSRLNGQDEQRLSSLLWDNRPARPCPCHSGPGSRRPDWIRIERARPRSERRGRISSWPAVMLTIHNEWVHRFRKHPHSRLGGKAGEAGLTIGHPL